jgi:redox-sensitive bicupin YhaK (pirin superfamily)
MKTVLHSAQSRGHAFFSWLDSYHSFSFGQFYDSKRMHFGVLRVLNDDTVSGGRGFGFHPTTIWKLYPIPLEVILSIKTIQGPIR